MFVSLLFLFSSLLGLSFGQSCSGNQFVVAKSGTTYMSINSLTNVSLCGISNMCSTVSNAIQSVASSSPGLSVSLASNTASLSLDSSVWQQRIGSACSAGSAITSISATGVPTCTPFLTSVTLGAGMVNSGTTISTSGSVAVNFNSVQQRVSGTCSGYGSAIKSVDSSGNVVCTPAYRGLWNSNFIATGAGYWSALQNSITLIGSVNMTFTSVPANAIVTWTASAGMGTSTTGSWPNGVSIRSCYVLNGGTIQYPGSWYYAFVQGGGAYNTYTVSASMTLASGATSFTPGICFNSGTVIFNQNDIMEVNVQIYA